MWLLVKTCGSRNVFADEICPARCRPNAFHAHITVTVQILKFFSYFESLFRRQLSPKKDKRIKELRKPVTSSG